MSVYLVILASAFAVSTATTPDTAGVADVNGTRLYYETRGSGEPLVLIHGGYMDSRMWDEHVARFSRRYRVIRYDLRGAGRSLRNHTAPYVPAEDLNALLQHLGAGRVHVVGLSRGGAIALDFVLRFPERVRSLVVVEPALPGLQALAPSSTGTATLPSMADIAQMARSNVDSAAALLLAFPPFEKIRKLPAQFAALRRIILDNGHLLAGGDGERFLREPSIAQRLTQIEAPVLAIAGDAREDSYTGQVHAALRSQIRNVQAVRMSGAGHFPNLEQPDEFERVVATFLSRIR